MPASPPPGQSLSFEYALVSSANGAEERIARDEAPLHVEVAADRRLRTGLPDRDHAAQQQPAVRDPVHEDAARADVHDDPVRHGAKVEELAPNPAPLPVRPAGQAQLVPPGAVGPMRCTDREHDCELLVAAQTMQHAHDPRVLVGRCANRRTRGDELPGRGQPHRRCVRGRGGRRPEHDGHAEGEKQCAEACAS